MTFEIIFAFVIFLMISYCQLVQSETADNRNYTQIACNADHRKKHAATISEAKCGLELVYTLMPPTAAFEQISPTSVYIKRCIGICQYINDGNCISTDSIVRYISVRVFNAKTNKESCAWYSVEEDVNCACVSDSLEETDEETRRAGISDSSDSSDGVLIPMWTQQYCKEYQYFNATTRTIIYDD